MDQAEPTAVGGEHSESIGEADSSRWWTKGANAPFRGRTGNWFVDGSTIYFHPKFNGDRTLVYTYDIPTQKWSYLPWCGDRSMFSVAVINGMVTAIGGYERGIEGLTFKTHSSASLKQVKMGSGWSNSHPCQPSDPTQLSCTLESISLWLGDIKKATPI